MGPRRLAVLGFSSMIFWAAACGDDAATPTVDAATPPVDADSPVDAQLVDAGASYAAPVARGVLPSAPLPETSGLVASRRQADVLWAHNDSGNPAELFALGTDGSLRATFAVRGATNQDWEDVARIPGDPEDTIVLADTGDNLARDTDGASGRASVTLYLVPEPDVAAGDAPVDAQALTLTYPDRPYDCEAVFVDPATSDVWLLTKEAAPAEVFVARGPLAPGSAVTLEHAGQVDFGLVTAADQSEDGLRLAVRGYGHVVVYAVTAGDVFGALTGPPSARPAVGSLAEAIAFEAGGYGLYTVAEGRGATLFYYAAR